MRANDYFMGISTYKRLSVALGIACFVLLALSGWLFWNDGWLTIHVAYASEQAQIFEDMRAKALKSGITEAADCLRYVVFYYPSGTKQEAGSKLDRIVERERDNAARAIISYLRARTNEDLGDDPENWIKKYANK